MTQQEYENQKRESWQEYFKHVVCGTGSHGYWFNKIFDRAYALGKEKETITQEEIEKTAEKYTERAYYPVGQSDCHEGFHMEAEECLAKAFKAGANFALGKQEKDADAVIQGWVARDKKYNTLNLHGEKPYRTKSGYQEGDEPDWWESDCASFLPIDENFFPDLTWDSDPEPVEIVLKRKKK